MPQFSTRAVQWILRTTGVYRKLFSGGPTFAGNQAKALSVPSVPSAKELARVNAVEFSFQGRPVWDIAPKDRAPVATMLYWHGGGYVYPAAAAHWAFITHMAETHGWRVVAPLYPLAPMSEVVAITGFALDFYKDFLTQQGGKPFLMGGDSAGGGLTAALAMAVRDAGLILPEKLLLVCPWLEVVPGHPDQSVIEKRDAILTIRGLREAGEMYAGAAGTGDPRVSPIHGNWDGLPPILSFGGGDDILVVDARALKAKLPSVAYHEEAGMIHDWPIFTFAESRAAQKRMAAWASG